MEAAALPQLAGVLVSMSTHDLLKPQAKVFTNKKRGYGPFSVILAIVSVAVLLPIYASFVGALIPLSLVMLVVAVLGAVVVPWVLAHRLRSRGPRLFCFINILLALSFLLVLGGHTDRALERHGLRPFESLAEMLGADEPESHAATGVGRVLIRGVRALTVSAEDTGAVEDGEEGKALPAEERDVPEAEPRAEASARPAGEPAEHGAQVEKESPTSPRDEPEPGIQAFKEPGDEGAPRPGVVGSSPSRASAYWGGTRPAGDGTYTVVAGPRAEHGSVEVPIQRDGRTFSVGVLVNGRVPADFVFDTGADFTAITPALARRLGFDPDALDDRRTFHTAGGPVEDPVVRVQSLAIDDAEVRDIDVVVCTRCPSNLLGRNFQSRFRVEIDGAEGVLRLHGR